MPSGPRRLRIRTLLFVLGHIVGAILMALALRGSIPTIGWIAMILSQPGHVVAFVVLQSTVADALAWVSWRSPSHHVRAVLRTPNKEWDLPPALRH